jgi:hypothetical protein
MISSDHAFNGVAALLFVASAAVTIVWCASMSSMRRGVVPRHVDRHDAA